MSALVSIFWVGPHPAGACLSQCLLGMYWWREGTTDLSLPQPSLMGASVSFYVFKYTEPVKAGVMLPA